MSKTTVELFEHQKEALRRMGENKFYALFLEQGVGKTLPTLYHIADLLVSGAIENALIICPLAVKGSWYRDMELFSPFYRKILKSRVTVVNYDIIWRRPEYLKPWGCVVLDESHFIKSRGSRRSKYVRKLARYAEYRYILTGTPIGNGHLEEIWSQYDFLSPTVFGEKYSQFEKKHCILDQYFKPKAYTNTDEIHDKIFSCAYRVKKIDCLDLPEKLPAESYLLELGEKAMYKEMLKNYIAELDIEASNPLVRMVKLRSLCSGFIKDEDGILHVVKSSKPSALVDLLDNWDKKLVIFAEFKESIRVITETLVKLKIKHVVLDGAQKDKTIWKKFQQDPAIQVIVCQYRTASAGIDLYAADTVVFYEPTLSSQINEQAKDRIHRAGQKEKCSYIYLLTKSSVETAIFSALERHADFSERMLQEYLTTPAKGGEE